MCVRLSQAKGCMTRNCLAVQPPPLALLVLSRSQNRMPAYASCMTNWRKDGGRAKSTLATGAPFPLPTRTSNSVHPTAHIS